MIPPWRDVRSALRGGALGVATAGLTSGMIVEERLRGVTLARRDAWLRRWATATLKSLGARVIVAPGTKVAVLP